MFFFKYMLFVNIFLNFKEKINFFVLFYWKAQIMFIVFKKTYIVNGENRGFFIDGLES